MSFLLLFVLGMVLGSFFNVIGLRVPKGQSIVAPRSHCPYCKRTLATIELIPVLSYVWQRGRCRNCRQKISPLYPFVELAVGSGFSIMLLVFGWNMELLVALALVSLFSIIFVSDLVYMIIPDRIILFFAILFVLFRATLAPLNPWWDAWAGAVVGYILLFIVYLIDPNGIGGGDVKLFTVLGFVLGWKLTLVAIMLSSLFGAIGGGVGMMLGRIKRREPIPFGPFIILGSLTAYLYGEALIQWYVRWL
ncbi:A24 family peptidase [Halalkalibacterium halodurans]|uniref:Prepilin leader peptidase/N-methyltransferase n=1 Tax=Halalkalibacterium halodurans TaxID=86665 RepID=A0A0M0KMS5_ALKHA|nr:A24 family peptidase [Halalkalibacterium halodurans]MED3646600.1 A24 family peptidase [Halalkalibacterium halodurans]TPE68307.1 prepilin peptidase [Halalkalibacterium halodurans]